MSWLVVGACTMLVVELAMRLPILGTGRELLDVAARSVATLRRRRASDHWKEVALRGYALRMFGRSLLLLILLLAAVGPALGVAAFAQSLGVPVYEAATSMVGLLLCLAVATVQVALSRRRRHGAG